MAYIGKIPTVGNFQKCDAISTSATATFNLLVGSVAVFPETANNCIVSLNGVIQAPTTAYTIVGSTIVFNSALTSADVIDFILILGNVLDIGTPSDGTVSTAKVADDAITLAKMAAGTDGNLITYDASGNPAAVATGSDGQVLTSAGAGQPPAFEAAAAGGKVLQVVTGTHATEVTINSTTYTDSGLTAAITCAATSSKVLVLANPNTGMYQNGNVKYTYQHQLLRDSTSICEKKHDIGSGTSGNGWNYQSIDGSITYLDSPSSTSELTYKIQGKVSNTGNSTTIGFQRNTGVSMIALIEIGA